MSAPDQNPEEGKTDGATRPVSSDTLDWLKHEIDDIVTAGDEGLYDAHLAAQETRLCLWDGQAPDCRKRAAYNNDEPVMPFEGACDQRTRYADMVVNEKVKLMIVSALRAQVTVSGTAGDDTARAGKMTLLLRWLLHNELGFEYVKELIKLANYVCTDSPAVGLFGITWRKKTELELKTIDIEQLMELYMQQVMRALSESGDDGAGADDADIAAQAQAAADDFRAALDDPVYGDEDIAAFLMQFFPTLKRARARKVAKALRRDTVAEFPVPFVTKNGPEVSAKRIFEDWFVPINTTDFQSARVYFETEALTKTEVLERQVSDGWSKAFVDELLGGGSEGPRGHEGEFKLKEYVRSADGTVQQMADTYYRGLYEIITAHFTDANEDGIPGRYYTTFSYACQTAATEKRLLGYAHGLYPGHAVQREILSKRLLDSRGIAELAGTYQSMLKLFADSFGDYAQISGCPPIITRGRRSRGRLYIEPLIELPARRDGDYKWLTPPQYPVTIDKMVASIKQQGDEYFGREGPDVPQSIVEIEREFLVFWWLMNLAEIHRQLLQLCQQWMPDEMIQRITNSKGEPIIRSREEIQGQFDLQINYDPRVLDPDYLEKVGKIIKDILLAMDRDKTIQTTPIVSAILWWLFPQVAENALQSVEQGQTDELMDELKNYQQIRAGVEPEMIDDGSQNYQLRLSMYQQMEQANPAIYGDMSEDKQNILAQRIKHLGAMAQQYGENVQVGREGAKRALPMQE
jgi:hypothetical protein